MAVTTERAAFLADDERVFVCVFKPMSPYTTCTPTCSNAFAHAMFVCSSKRALS
jgi:hypothetical protein